MTTALEPRSVDAGRGLEWWARSWALFMKNPGMWVVLGLVALIVFLVLGVIPLLGTVATSLLLPVFLGHWMLAARKVEGGGTLEINDLFTLFGGVGHQPTLVSLLVLGGLLAATTIVMSLVLGMFGAGAVIGLLVGGAMHSGVGVLAAAGAGLMSLLVLLVVATLVGMAFWFAPALVVFHQAAPLEAVKASFAACLKNIAPFLLYSVIGLAAAIVASIPAGLGWLVLAPLTGLQVYVSTQDVFP